MSAKIVILTLDGKSAHKPRARAQRLVDSGTHVWIGPKTIREIKQAASVPTIHDRVRFEPTFFFDYAYPNADAHPELLDLPFTYPLPYEILKHYEGGRVRVSA